MLNKSSKIRIISEEPEVLKESLNKITIIPKYMKDVECIPETDGLPNNEDLIQYIEIPLRPAMRVLINKNIPTCASSANKKHKNTNISIVYDKLSKENKKIADMFCIVSQGRDNTKCANISIPYFENTRVEEVSKQALAVACNFKHQKQYDVEKLPLLKLLENYGINYDKIDGNSLIEKIASLEKMGFYYDKKEKVFYLSVEHYTKANFRPIEEE